MSLIPVLALIFLRLYFLSLYFLSLDYFSSCPEGHLLLYLIQNFVYCTSCNEILAPQWVNPFYNVALNLSF